MAVLIEGAEYNPVNNHYSVYVGDRFEGKSVEFRPLTNEEIHEFYDYLEEESKKDSLKDSFNLLDILKLFVVKSIVVPCLTDMELLNVCGITIRRDGVYEYFGYNKETETLGTIVTTKEKAEIHALRIIFLPAEIEIMINFICRQIQARNK